MESTEQGDISRRAALATLGSGVGGLLAGCLIGCANNGRSYDDYLQISVPQMRAAENDFTGTVSVTHDQENGQEASDGDELAGTRYQGVSVYGYTPDRTEAFHESIDEISVRETAEVDFETTDFRMVITAGADGTEQPDCYYGQVGAQLLWYAGHYEDDANVEETGHIWRPLWERRLDNPLPPSNRVFSRIKCKQRISRQYDPPDRPLSPESDTPQPRPSLSFVPGHREWTSEPIANPTVRFRFSVNYAGPESSYNSDPTLGKSVTFEQLPDRLKRVVEGKSVGRRTSRSEFLELISQCEDEAIESLTELPTCSNNHVDCQDNRGIECGDVLRGPRFSAL